MVKARYSNEIFIKNGKIRRSSPVGFDHASESQLEAIKLVKPVLNSWVKSKLRDSGDIRDARILVKSKYVETSNGLSIEFKVQSMEILDEQESVN